MEIDLEFYLLIHSDVSAFDDSALTLHFDKYGRSEGRNASPTAHRMGFTATTPKYARLLEIEPFTKAVFRGPNIKYLDVIVRLKRLVADLSLEKQVREHRRPARRPNRATAV